MPPPASRVTPLQNRVGAAAGFGVHRPKGRIPQAKQTSSSVPYPHTMADRLHHPPSGSSRTTSGQDANAQGKERNPESRISCVQRALTSDKMVQEEILSFLGVFA